MEEAPGGPFFRKEVIIHLLSEFDSFECAKALAHCQSLGRSAQISCWRGNSAFGNWHDRLSWLSRAADEAVWLPCIQKQACTRVCGEVDELMSESNQRPRRLLQVQVVFRHGARTPLTDLGTPCEWTSEQQTASSSLCTSRLVLPSGCMLDPAKTFAPTPTGRTLKGGGSPGVLTRAGLRQSLELGASLRRRYVDASAATSAEVGPEFLLPRAWSGARSLVTLRSTSMERTVSTARGVVAAMFHDDAVRGELVADVHLSSDSPRDEYLVMNDSNCARLKQLFAQGQRLSTLHLTPEQHEVIRQVEEGGPDGWRLVQPRGGSLRDTWKLLAYRDQYACRAAAHKPIPRQVEHVAAQVRASS